MKNRIEYEGPTAEFNFHRKITDDSSQFLSLKLDQILKLTQFWA